jgi:hypothetical protein
VESVIGVQGFSEFGEHMGIGVLEGLQQGMGLFIPIPALVIVRGMTPGRVKRLERCKESG